MKFVTALTALAVLATSAPAMAAPAAGNPAAKLSIASKVRSSSPTKGQSKLVGEESPFISVLLLAGAVVGILAIAGAIGDGEPDSA